MASTNGITGARGKQLAAGRGTIAGSNNAAPLAVERLTYHALLAGLQALLAEDYGGALTIAAEMAFIALMRPPYQPDNPDLQRLRRHAVQLLNQIRGELTLQEQLVVPPPDRAARAAPTRRKAPPTACGRAGYAVERECCDRHGRGSREASHSWHRYLLAQIGCMICCRPLKAAIALQAQAAFPDAPAEATLLRWHFRDLNFDLAVRKAALSAQIEARICSPAPLCPHE
jgi:hypothetical protein